MRALIAFVVDTDRHVQRAFDWCAHALMRRGLSKGQLRLAINVGGSATLAMSIALRWAWASDPPWFAVTMIAWSAAVAVQAIIEWDQDQRAAARGMLSVSDGGAHTGDKAWGLTFAVWGVIDGPSAEVVAACGRALAERGNVFSVAFWALTAAHGYLAKTPPDPPARRRRATSRIATSGA